MDHKIYSVAIDGPAGAGKSTIARRAAERLQFVYVDTGAIYRTVGYAACCRGIALDEPEKIAALLPELTVALRWTEDGLQHMLLNGQDVTAEIRHPEISTYASVCAAVPEVRAFLLSTQREVAKTHSVVMDGRDIGTVVLPDADVKIFLTASAEVRARRRFLELQAKGAPDPYETVLADMVERDRRDSGRAIAPLRQADDAVLVDTSALTLEQSIDTVVRVILERIKL